MAVQRTRAALARTAVRWNSKVRARDPSIVVAFSHYDSRQAKKIVNTTMAAASMAMAADHQWRYLDSQVIA